MCDIFITFLRFLYAISRCGSGVGTHEINESAIRNRSLKKKKGNGNPIVFTTKRLHVTKNNEYEILISLIQNKAKKYICN